MSILLEQISEYIDTMETYHKRLYVLKFEACLLKIFFYASTQKACIWMAKALSDLTAKT